MYKGRGDSDSPHITPTKRSPVRWVHLHWGSYGFTVTSTYVSVPVVVLSFSRVLRVVKRHPSFVSRRIEDVPFSSSSPPPDTYEGTLRLPCRRPHPSRFVFRVRPSVLYVREGSYSLTVPSVLSLRMSFTPNRGLLGFWPSPDYLLWPLRYKAPSWRPRGACLYSLFLGNVYMSEY